MKEIYEKLSIPERRRFLRYLILRYKQEILNEIKLLEHSLLEKEKDNPFFNELAECYIKKD